MLQPVSLHGLDQFNFDLFHRDAVASLALLADMAAQAKAIDILISHVHHVCHMTKQQLQDSHLRSCSINRRVITVAL